MGVSALRANNTYRVRVRSQGERHHLGSYTDPDQAHSVYQEALRAIMAGTFQDWLQQHRQKVTRGLQERLEGGSRVGVV